MVRFQFLVSRVSSTDIQESRFGQQFRAAAASRPEHLAPKLSRGYVHKWACSTSRYRNLSMPKRDMLLRQAVCSEGVHRHPLRQCRRCSVTHLHTEMLKLSLLESYFGLRRLRKRHSAPKLPLVVSDGGRPVSKLSVGRPNW